MFRATSSVDESLSDRGDAPITRHQRISECNTVYFIGDGRLSILNGVYCRSLPDRGVGALFLCKPGVIIWSSTNSPSKTCPSLDVNLLYEPQSIVIFIYYFNLF